MREGVDVKGDFAFDDFVAQVGMGDQVSDADASGAKCFGEGFEYDEVGVFGQEVYGGLVVEFAVGFIDHDEGVGAG